MLDELRRLDKDDDEFGQLDDFYDLEFDRRSEAGTDDRGFLGMTAVERMFLSIFFFMNVLILGLALLIATDRIVF